MVSIIYSGEIEVGSDSSFILEDCLPQGKDEGDKVDSVNSSVHGAQTPFSTGGREKIQQATPTQGNDGICGSKINFQNLG